MPGIGMELREQRIARHRAGPRKIHIVVALFFIWVILCLLCLAETGSASSSRRQHRSLLEQLEERHQGQRRLREQGFSAEDAEAIAHGLTSDDVGRSDDPETGKKKREFSYDAANGAHVDYVTEGRMKPGVINLDDVMGDISHVACSIFMTAKAHDKVTRWLSLRTHAPLILCSRQHAPHFSRGGGTRAHTSGNCARFLDPLRSQASVRGGDASQSNIIAVFFHDMDALQSRRAEMEAATYVASVHGLGCVDMDGISQSFAERVENVYVDEEDASIVLSTLSVDPFEMAETVKYRQVIEGNHHFCTLRDPCVNKAALGCNKLTKQLLSLPSNAGFILPPLHKGLGKIQ